MMGGGSEGVDGEEVTGLGPGWGQQRSQGAKLKKVFILKVMHRPP